MTLSVVRLLFVIAGLYDFLIGLTFLCFGPQLFDSTGVPHPNHWGYIQFGSLLLIIFETMFFAVAYDPVANRMANDPGPILEDALFQYVTTSGENMAWSQ